MHRMPSARVARGFLHAQNAVRSRGKRVPACTECRPLAWQEGSCTHRMAFARVARGTGWAGFEDLRGDDERQRSLHWKNETIRSSLLIKGMV